MFLLHTKIKPLTFVLIGVLFAIVVLSAHAQTEGVDAAKDPVASAVARVTVILRGKNSGGFYYTVATGVFVRADGLMLAPYSAVRSVTELSAQLADGEIYRAQILDFDERRNIALLRVPVATTPYISVAIISDGQDVGGTVRAVYGTGATASVADCGLLSAFALADEIKGAGTGFRVIKFTDGLPRRAETQGSVLLDGYGRAVGLVAPAPTADAANYAVPLYNLAGLVRGIPVGANPVQNLSVAPSPQDLQRASPVYQSSTTPLAAMPQPDIPQRPTTALQPAGIGSRVLPETNPAKLLANAKTLYVVSYSNVFKSVQLVNQLRKKNEITEWNIALVDDRDVADLILEIEHVALTWEFNFTVRHARSGIIVTTGKVYAWGGNDGGKIMADRVVSNFKKLRAAQTQEKGK